MARLTITATKTVSPDKKVNRSSQVVMIDDDVQILPREGNTKALIVTSSGWQYEVDAEVSEVAAALNSEDVSAYT